MEIQFSSYVIDVYIRINMVWFLYYIDFCVAHCFVGNENKNYLILFIINIEENKTIFKVKIIMSFKHKATLGSWHDMWEKRNAAFAYRDNKLGYTHIYIYEPYIHKWKTH